MKRIGLALALLALTAPAMAQRPARRPGVGTANPSALIAAEIAFARAAREKGQWTAFRDFADDEAVMFVPQPVLARDWLKGRANPVAPIQWQPYQVWMSCDGTLGVTKGAWQRPDGTVGYFTTIWRQEKKGGYRWVLDQGDSLTKPMEQPDMLSASVAECPAFRRDGPDDKRDKASRTEPREKLRVAGMEGGGRSEDGTLTWTYRVSPDNARSVSVSLRKGGKMAEILSLTASGAR